MSGERVDLMNKLPPPSFPSSFVTVVTAMPCAAIRGPMLRCCSRSLGIKSRTKMFKFRCFLDPFDQSHYYPKYEIWAIETKLWDYLIKPLADRYLQSSDLP